MSDMSDVCGQSLQQLVIDHIELLPSIKNDTVLTSSAGDDDESDGDGEGEGDDGDENNKNIGDKEKVDKSKELAKRWLVTSVSSSLSGRGAPRGGRCTDFCFVP